MVRYQKLIARHVAKMTAQHMRHKGVILKIVHAIRQHPGAYKPGYRPSKAALPKSFPRKPAGLHTEASGMWDWAKKGWNWVKAKFNQHKGKIAEHAKKHASSVAKRVGSRVASSASRVGNRVLDKLEQVAESNIAHYTDKAEKKIESLGKRATDKLSKWEKKKVSDGMPGKTTKKGSGLVTKLIGGRGGVYKGPYMRGVVRAAKLGR